MNSMKLERMCKIFWTFTFFAMRMLIARASFSKLSAWYDFLSADHFTEKELLAQLPYTKNSTKWPKMHSVSFFLKRCLENIKIWSIMNANQKLNII